MSDPRVPPVEPGVDLTLEGGTRAGRWQVGLRTLFLATAAIAVWMAVFSEWQKVRSLAARIEAARPLARELTIDDPNQVAVVKREEQWYDDNHWDIHLPSGRYRLRLATRGIGQTEFAPVVKSEPIEAGRHDLALSQQRGDMNWQVHVTQDGSELFSWEEPREWDPAVGSVGGGQYSLSTQLSADQPFVLFRRRFTRLDAQGRSMTPLGPCEGILLWIEPVEAAKRKR